MTVEDWQSINCFFSKKLSNQIIFDNIYPYIYEPQPKYLLDDIKSFFSGYEEMEKFYKETLTAHQFWRDIFNFLEQKEPTVGYFNNGKPVPIRGKLFKDNVIMRLYGFKDTDRKRLCYYYIGLFFKHRLSLSHLLGFWLIDPDSKDLINLCKKVFALFTPDERIDFMENWVHRNNPPREEYIQEWEIENNYTSESDEVEDNTTIMVTHPSMRSVNCGVELFSDY
mgnify:CR=1 FL=1|tara:strand:+ start:281 stop:952 length:672 start_codon:yes stop_codon:yes gene_type:complete